MLTDFGVSHSSRMSRGLLHQGQIAVGLGTHGYRAPEQDSRAVQSFDLRDGSMGRRRDRLAMHTGIDLNKRQDVLRKQEDGNIYGLRRLSDVHLTCSPTLEEVVMGLLFIEPSRRPGGAAEVLAQVRAIASGFGLDAQTVAAARRNCADPDEIDAVIDALVDPLWASICRAPGFDRYFAKFEDGDVLSAVGETAHHTFLLLQGEIGVERDGELIDVERREGYLVGAISTLTGAPRTVTLRARGPVWDLHLQRGRARAARDVQLVGRGADDPDDGRPDRDGPTAQLTPGARVHPEAAPVCVWKRAPVHGP